MKYESLYLHIPFCKKRCAYCDFTTEAVAQDDPVMDEYLAQLISEIRQATKKGELAQIRTIYLGGGTPTHLGHKRLVELAYLLSLNIKLEQVEEYTIEANPESLTEAIVNDLFALGVNRLSLGVQSFVDSELKTLGRIHDADRAKKAVADARGRFTNISLDLMCGIPGQTADSWQYSLEQALLQSPEHLSIYPLQLEEGTELAQRAGVSGTAGDKGT
ncbi:MAG: radical SAM protein, partial [Coriobacteriia bacterium]|nr:radical SAM protein [Coriobacteriia bacterium]